MARKPKINSSELVELLAEAQTLTALRKEKTQASSDSAAEKPQASPISKASDIVDTALNHAQQNFAELPNLGELKEQVERITSEIEASAKEHPAVALLAAGALGFIVAQFISRK